MNGGQFTVLISIIIILSLTLIIRSQHTWNMQQKKGPGISSCTYYGYVDEECGYTDLIPIDITPNECTSIIWNGLTFKSDHRISYSFMNGNDEGVLDILLKYGKPVYVYCGQYNQKTWAHVFGCDGSDAEINTSNNMEALKAYMDAHPGIVGVIFTKLELEDDSSECKGFTDHLVNYIKAMRKMFPDLEIGIELLGITLLEYYANPKMEWLDFNVLDDSLDFYEIYVGELNDCTSELRVSGIAPVTDNAPNTLTKVQECLDIINIPSGKTYYNVALNAASANSSVLLCKTTYQQICTKPSETSSYCADTTQSFFEKGQFIKQNAAGFFGTYIDFADPYNLCGCSRPFASFYDVLDGFKDSPAPESCQLMDDRL